MPSRLVIDAGSLQWADKAVDAVFEAAIGAFATLQGFKGLEADAIVLREARKGHRHSSAQHLYVAASRARHVLAVAEYRSAES